VINPLLKTKFAACPPNMEFLYSLGYPGLFIGSFLAATILPFSSEALLSLLIYSGYNIGWCLIISTAGNTLGGMSSYYLGKLGKWKWIEKYMGVKQKKVERFQDKMKISGPFLAFFCWLPVIGDLIAVFTGVMRFNPWHVLLFMLAGKAARYAVWAWITFRFSGA
jgi:membrane protein YqaA with SNARE-associated domain